MGHPMTTLTVKIDNVRKITLSGEDLPQYISLRPRYPNK